MIRTSALTVDYHSRLQFNQTIGLVNRLINTGGAQFPRMPAFILPG
jgi:hypothetical protein